MSYIVGFGLAAGAGGRASLVVLGLGLFHYTGYFELSDPYLWIASPPVLAVVGVLALVEILADMSPDFSELADLAGYLPAAIAGFIALSAVTGQVDDSLLRLSLSVCWVGPPGSVCAGPGTRFGGFPGGQRRDLRRGPQDQECGRDGPYGRDRGNQLHLALRRRGDSGGCGGRWGCGPRRKSWPKWPNDGHFARRCPRRGVVGVRERESPGDPGFQLRRLQIRGIPWMFGVLALGLHPSSPTALSLCPGRGGCRFPCPHHRPCRGVEARSGEPGP